MVTMQDLNRYLSLEAFRSARQRGDKKGLTTVKVQIDGHPVSVTEDENGVVELYET